MAGKTIRKFRGQRTNNKVTPIQHDMDNSSDIGRALMKKQADLTSARRSEGSGYPPDGSANYNTTQSFPAAP